MMGYDGQTFRRFMAEHVRPQRGPRVYSFVDVDQRTINRIAGSVERFTFETGLRPQKIYAPAGRLSHTVARAAQYGWNRHHPLWSVPFVEPYVPERGDRIVLLKMTAVDGRRLEKDLEAIARRGATPIGVISIIDANFVRRDERTVADVAEDLGMPYFAMVQGKAFRRHMYGALHRTG